MTANFDSRGIVVLSARDATLKDGEEENSHTHSALVSQNNKSNRTRNAGSDNPQYHVAGRQQIMDSLSALSVTENSEITKTGNQTAGSPSKMLTTLPRINRTQSCILTNVVSTCVNKAASHLELLQTLIEEWFAVLEERQICSGHSTAVADLQKTRISAQFRDAAAPRTSLSVDGRGVVSTTSTTPAKSKHSIADELPYLGAQEVIDEVFALIIRLETDRQTKELALEQEKSRAQMLIKKTDELALRRAKEFPRAVQAEHDAAVEDLNEMHWHVTYKSRNEEKLKGRVEVASIFNKRLSEDIGYVKKHCPLVEEKLALELQAMQKINEAQGDTNKELELTLERLAKTKVRNEEAHAKTAAEREQIAKDLEAVRKELNDAVTALADARMLHNTYVHQMADTRQQIQDNLEEKKVLSVKSENARLSEQMQLRRVEELTNKSRTVELEHHRLEGEAFTKQSEYDLTVSTMESQYAALKKALDHEEDLLKKVTRENEDYTIEIDNLTRKVNKTEKSIADDDKALRRMNASITNTEMMMNQMLDEFNKVAAVHVSVRDKLQEERERVTAIEEGLRHTLELLKKQCKDEIHTRSVLHSRITSDNQDLVKSQVEAKQKKEKLTKTVVELEETLKVVNDKVDKLKDIYNSKKEILDGLEAEINQTLEEKAKVIQEYTDTKQSLDPYLTQLQEEKKSLFSQIDTLNTQMSLMDRKREDMEHTIKILQKSIKTQEEAVKNLEREFSELTIQLEAQTQLHNGLLGSRDDVKRRTETREKEHDALIRQRSETLTEHRITLQSELEMNKVLAVNYRQLQSHYVDLKSKVMDMFDERNRLEAGIKDLKQLKGLQSRLRRALETYHKFRGLFNAGELERVQMESRISASKVTVLQEKYHHAVHNITAFLNSQMQVLNERNVVSAVDHAVVIEPVHAV